MKLHEHHSRLLFADYGIPTSRGEAVETANAAADAFGRLKESSAIAKVQVLMGGRGKAGGVCRVHSPGEAASFAARFLGKPFSTAQSAGKSETVRSILVTEDKKILEEYYLGVTVDRSRGLPVVLFSKQGGVEIEEVAVSNPEAIAKIHFSPSRIPASASFSKAFEALLPSARLRSQLSDIASSLCRLFVEKDASLCEINPLAVIADEVMLALDAKIVLDDNALFRQEKLAGWKDPEEEDARERAAKRFGLTYVSMDGNVGCLVNGAGLAMATMDMIKRAGGEPANFLDVGGSATADTVREGFKIILQDTRVQAILVNIFGGIMKCDVIAEGVIQASREIRLQVPLIVRLEGTNVEAGRDLLKKSGLRLTSCHTVQEAAESAVRQARELAATHAHTR